MDTNRSTEEQQPDIFDVAEADLKRWGGLMEDVLTAALKTPMLTETGPLRLDLFAFDPDRKELAPYRIAETINAYLKETGAAPSITTLRARFAGQTKEILDLVTPEIDALEARLVPLDARYVLDQLRDAAPRARLGQRVLQASSLLKTGQPIAVIETALNGGRKVKADIEVETEVPIWDIMDAADDWDVPETEFNIEDLYPRRGVVWTGGTPKIGKSLFTFYSVLAAAKDRAAVADKFLILRRPKVLYIAREDSLSRIKGREQDILSAWDGQRPARGRLLFLAKQPVDLLKPTHVAEIVALCKRERIEVVVLDTWTALSPGADPMSPKDQAGLAEVVKQLQADIDGLIVVVDHTRKNRPEGTALSAADIYGPNQKWAAAEHIIMIAATEDDFKHEMFIEGKDGDTLRFFITRSPRGSGVEKYTYAGSTDSVRDRSISIGTSNRQAVYDVVAASPEPMSTTEVMGALALKGIKMEIATVRTHLSALSNGTKRRLEKIGSNKNTRYRVLADPPSQRVGESE